MIDDTFSIRSAETEREIIDKLNRIGFVVLEGGDEDESGLRRKLCSLVKLFGSPVYHQASDDDGVVPVEEVPDTIYVGPSSAAFPFHTDGSFLALPPPVFALQCSAPAYAGGDSLLVDGLDIYRCLLDDGKCAIEPLFDADAIRVETLRGLNVTVPLFESHGDRTFIRFRSPDQEYSITPKVSASPGFEEICHFVESTQKMTSFKMKRGQILVVDNYRMLHARTAFQNYSGHSRLFYRLWFDGQPKESFHVHCGFQLSH